jgi:branched-chain amino acid transport system permease protein
VLFTLQQALQGYQNWSTLIIGVLLILIIRLAPDGIWKALVNGFQRLRSADQQEENTVENIV